MFDHVISSLSPAFATEVRDLLLKPPAEHPYNTLKAELIKRTAASEQRNIQQLISGEELGDRKPTQLLRRMQQLLGDQLATAGETNNFLREHFLQRLPANVRMVLASTDQGMELHRLADMADKVMEVATPSVAAITSTPPIDVPRTSDKSDLKQLTEKVSRLASLVASMTSVDQPRHNRSRSVSRFHRPHSPAPKESQDNSLCFYHQKFGEDARKCRQPCSWGNFPAGH